MEDRHAAAETAVDDADAAAAMVARVASGRMAASADDCEPSVRGPIE